MMIVSRQAVRAALDRALALDPEDMEAAIAATAAALGLPAEAVRDVAEQAEEVAS